MVTEWLNEDIIEIPRILEGQLKLALNSGIQLATDLYCTFCKSNLNIDVHKIDCPAGERV